MTVNNNQLLMHIWGGLKSAVESQDVADLFGDFDLPDETFDVIGDALRTVTESNAGIALSNIPLDEQRRLKEQIESNESLDLEDEELEDEDE